MVCSLVPDYCRRVCLGANGSIFLNYSVYCQVAEQRNIVRRRGMHHVLNTPSLGFVPWDPGLWLSFHRPFRGRHGREKKTTSSHFPFFLLDCYSLWVSSISLLVVFVKRCAEHTKGLFRSRPSFVLSCCIIMYLYPIARVPEPCS
jgi:hypothetical protein